MTDGNSRETPCARAESVAAYLDGELDAPGGNAFEAHLKECPACSAALLEQRRLLCLLDAAFDSRADERHIELPKDFARVVTARAQNDMCGVRSARERAFSIKLSLLLAAAAALLLGASASDDVLAPLSALARTAAGAASVVWNAVLDAGRGAVVILRPLSGRLVSVPGPVTGLYWLLFAGALVTLLRLIRSYHRAQE